MAARRMRFVGAAGLVMPGLVEESPMKRGANIKSRILGPLIALLAASRRTYLQCRAFRVVSHLWTMSIVRPLRFLGVLLVLYAMVGWYIFPPAEVPADAVGVPLWLFLSGVCALIVDEVGERITREAREVMDRKEWSVLAWTSAV